MAFPAVFPWRTSLLVIHGNIILREIGAGWLVCPAAGWAPGEGEIGGNAGPGTFSSLRGRPEVESSVGFNSNSGWNTHKPPTSSRGCSLGLRSRDFGRAGALCQPPPTEPASSESLAHLEHMEKDPENREKERNALAPRPAPPRSIQVLRISLAVSPDGTTWFGATCAFRCVPIRGGRSDRGEGGELTPKAPPRGN